MDKKNTTYKFKEWFDSKNESFRSFARRCRLPHATIRNAYLGKNISLRIAKKICKETKKEIDVADFGYEK